jgi:YfiR/HmsC-like
MGFLTALRLLSLLLLAPGAAAQGGATPEYQLKAVFLFNFAQFVEWPPTAFDSAGEPIVIGVLGSDPFGGYLDETVMGETVHGRSLEVRRFRTVDEVGPCHILFVAPGDAPVERVLRRLEGMSVLTVSDGERFATAGGMIGFVTEEHRIRLRINLEAARAARLTISSKLLRPARIVSTGGS